ncbi:ABC transporter substrate-binding protein [Proteiniphilum sp. UBA5510]|jgi:iron complex transport system substrate-binding protein|uniref:ABC transporter substrate-binding protein n=2 Tax=unclassified Proteiniphilum TaxID=2622718 RepID=UPI002579D965|nr:ABC transporter substrate-binding protein [Proteiniphilum sp. UBA5510]
MARIIKIIRMIRMKIKIIQNKYNHIFTILILSFFSLPWGCHPRQDRDKSAEELIPNSSVAINYAEGFRIEHFNEFTKVTINNPWTKDNKPYAVYYLYKEDSTGMDAGDEGIKLKIPISSLVVNSFSYFEFLYLLNEQHSIKGVTDGFRIYNSAILQKIESGEIIDLGDPFKPNIEKTMALRPQAVINSAYAQVDRYSEQLIRAGFPVISSLEWMEKSPLARAEWIKLIAAFFDKEVLGDSIFNDMEKRYLAIKEKVKSVSKQYAVLPGDNFQGTWYIPGGQSFNASLFRDAQLDYRYKNNSATGSIGLDIESILTQFGNAEFWFGCDAGTYGELVEKDAKYLLLESVKKRHVYNNRNRVTPSGGNDYFESAVANPDLVLSDLIKAAYPEQLLGYRFTYIKPLEEIPAREK